MTRGMRSEIRPLFAFIDALVPLIGRLAPVLLRGINNFRYDLKKQTRHNANNPD